MNFNYGSRPGPTNADFFHLIPIPKLYWGNICCLPNVYPFHTSPWNAAFCHVLLDISYISVMPSAKKSRLSTALPPPAATFSNAMPQSFVPFHCSWQKPWGHPWPITFFHPLNPKPVRNVVNSFIKLHPVPVPALWLVLWSWLSPCHLELCLPQLMGIPSPYHTGNIHNTTASVIPLKHKYSAYHSFFKTLQ